MVRAFAAMGVPQRQIITMITNPVTGRQIHLETLSKHFRAELDQGMVEANFKVAKALFENATINQNVSAQIWWEKTRMGMRDNISVENSGTVNHTGAVSMKFDPALMKQIKALINEENDG
jgi:hypothetical protein